MANLINQPAGQTPVDEKLKDGSLRLSQPWAQFFSQVSALLIALTLSGATAKRPSSFLWVGRIYFDTTLGFPIWYVGPGWVNSAGAPA